jgi:hypothetical protein
MSTTFGCWILAHEALLGVCEIEDLLAQNLERDALLHGDVHGLVHIRHAADADQRADFVSPEQRAGLDEARGRANAHRAHVARRHDCGTLRVLLRAHVEACRRFRVESEQPPTLLVPVGPLS